MFINKIDKGSYAQWEVRRLAFSLKKYENLSEFTRSFISRYSKEKCNTFFLAKKIPLEFSLVSRGK